MKKTILSILALGLCINYCYAQDTITLNSNQKISAKVLEVTSSEIKYSKSNSLNSETFSILKSDVLMIKYENGTMDILNKISVPLDEELLKISRENPNELTKKGNNVFVKFPSDETRMGEKYFIQDLKDFGYWNIVNNENESHFIIEFNFKMGYAPSAFVTLITRENKEFKKSKTYRSTPTLFNKYNPVREVVDKIIGKFIKVEFKQI